ncbi:MAG: AlpA family phage regulatory protein [Methylobacter sp.]|nr:AlpA family phage regulatory protein [Methylobacter sp.]MDP2098621.1 AlpA family phage regulatory protein [Methylobacter sp.]MDP2426965.1 AlpA family phage regulatory protein [Methylobacter sp.]MDP3056178.1 AlpA family phage regulatory protein [Methylobacter sp.]MDP3360615.1 AlpA family phage regulatory protein [Methylobacter sp.]
MAVTALKPDYLIQKQPPQLPETGFVRLWDIVGDKNATPPIPAIIPVCRSTWLNGCKSGKYPKPVKLSERTTAWRVSDIRAFIDSMGAQ